MKKILKISTLLFALMLIVSSCGQTEEEYAKAKDHNGAEKNISPINTQDYVTTLQRMVDELQSKVKQYDAEADSQTDEENQKRLQEVQGMEKRIKQYQQDSNFGKAVTDLTKAIELDPNDAVSYVGRGYSKHNLKDYNGAIRDYTKAIELDHNYTNAYVNRGISKNDLKDYNGAIADYTKAIELDPNYTNAYINRSLSKFFINDLKGACEDAKKSASLGFDNSKLIEIFCKNAAVTDVYILSNSFKVAKAYLNSGKSNKGHPSGAISDYTKAIELDPNLADAYFNRGISKFFINDLKGACEDAKKSASLGYDASEVIEIFCKNAAITDVTKAIELDPNDAKAYFIRGISKYNLKDYNGAIRDYTKAIELDPNLAKAYINRGLSKHNLKDYNGAIRDYTKAIELDPNLANAYNNRSISKELLGDLTGACADAKKAINLGSNSSVKWVASNCN